VSTLGSGLRARFQHGIRWNVSAAIVSQGANFLTSIVVANLLGREQFGQFGIVQSTLLTLVGVAQIATGVTATKYVAEFRSTDKGRVGRILGLCSAVTFVSGLIAAVAIFIAAPWLAAYTLKAPALAFGLKVAAAAVLFSVINGYQVGALAGLESYRALAMCSAAQGLFQVSVCSVAAWLWGLNGALVGLPLSALARWVIFHLATRHEALKQGIRFTYGGLWQEHPILLRFAIPAALAGFSSPPAMWLGNAFLVRSVQGYSQMAIFSAAFNLKSMVMFLPLLLNNVGMSLLNTQKGQADEIRYRKVFWINLLLTGVTAGAGALGIAVVGRHLLHLYGRSFIDGYSTLVLLAFSSIIEAVAIASYQVVQSQEKMWLSLFAIAMPRDLALAALAYYLTPNFGAFGLGLAYSVSWLLCTAITLASVYSIGLRLRPAEMYAPAGEIGV
jgi:O-antigen/teichoic acid export membrane protein